VQDKIMSILLNCSDILMQAMILLFSFLITTVSHENLAGSVVTVNVVAKNKHVQPCFLLHF